LAAGMVSAGQPPANLPMEFHGVKCQRGTDDILAHGNIDAAICPGLRGGDGILKGDGVIRDSISFCSVCLDAQIINGIGDIRIDDRQCRGGTGNTGIMGIVNDDRIIPASP